MPSGSRPLQEPPDGDRQEPSIKQRTADQACFTPDRSTQLRGQELPVDDQRVNAFDDEDECGGVCADDDQGNRPGEVQTDTPPDGEREQDAVVDAADVPAFAESR